MFFPPELVECARAHPELVQHCTDRAAPGLAMDDDALWSLVFGNTISRSWMVWSDGHCPACLKDVNMYRWEIDPIRRPWKLRCPRCAEVFPKNDFAAFYRSGLDDSGVFDPHMADRQLLVFEDDAPPGDRPADFGIDDGEGYTQEDRCWRFIGTYLVYGQWKGLVVAGVQHLAAAYVASGNPLCAGKAGILLDRVADLYPSFDFGQQGVLYERPGDRGYVSTWHDACEEVQTLCLAYDQVRDALRQDTGLSAFLSRKADEFHLPTDKGTPEQICENIEVRIFRDTLDHVDKIQSNFPTTDMAVIVIRVEIELGEGGNTVAGHAGVARLERGGQSLLQ